MKKKLCSVLAFSLMATSLSAQNPIPKVAFDYFPSGNNIKVGSTQARLGDYRVRIGVDYLIKNFTLSGDVYTYMDWANRDKVVFSPRLAEYYITVKYKIKEINVSYQHLCTHPIKVDRLHDAAVYGGYDMISISYNY